VCPFSQEPDPKPRFEAVAELFAGDGPGGPGKLKEGAREGVKVEQPQTVMKQKLCGFQLIPKVYFTDLGLRNILLGLTSIAQLERLNQYGLTLENAVVNRLSAWLPLLNPEIRLHYWRTRSKEEVDLVISAPDRLIPVEVKSDKKLQTRQLKGLRSFLQKENENIGILVGRFEDAEIIEEGKAKIILLPHWLI
jgi:predicted AAA+ superfamily ATPase